MKKIKHLNKNLEKGLITIGFDKNGEADFGIRGDLSELTIKELNELRTMIPVAIYVAEDMWRRNNPTPAGEQKSDK